jgi:S-methylmethionine-dependent homocysteine/selenocysteine methylase
MNVAQAEAYHARPDRDFQRNASDMVTAITMTNANEAIGITRAAVAAGMPVAISFTLETDGCLPTGQSLEDAIGAVDTATRRAPGLLHDQLRASPPTSSPHCRSGRTWVQRLRGIRANASQRSHAELDQAKDLDAGDPG